MNNNICGEYNKDDSDWEEFNNDEKILYNLDEIYQEKGLIFDVNIQEFVKEEEELKNMNKAKTSKLYLIKQKISELSKKEKESIFNSFYNDKIKNTEWLNKEWEINNININNIYNNRNLAVFTVYILYLDNKFFNIQNES